MKNTLPTAPSADGLDLQNPDLRRAVGLLLALQHALCRDDEEAADELRDDLSAPLRRLSWEQNEWLRGLSGDLEMLCDNEVFEPNPYSPEEYRAAFLDAWVYAESNPNRLLTLLRYEQGFLTADMIAFARARAYELLDFDELYPAFIQKAIALRPDHLDYRLAHLGSLMERKQYEEAAPFARVLLEFHDLKPAHVILMLGALLRAADTLPEDEQRRELGQIRRRLEQAFAQTPPEAMKIDDAEFGLLLLASVMERLGRAANAEDCYRRALQIHPDDPDIQAAFALFLWKQGRAAPALALFERAVRGNTELPTAYLLLARRACEEGRYQQAEGLCRQMLRTIRPTSSRALAFGYEMLGIALGGQEKNPEEMLSCFQKAADLQPEYIPFQQNLETARNLVGQRSVQSLTLPQLDIPESFLSMQPLWDRSVRGFEQNYPLAA